MCTYLLNISSYVYMCVYVCIYSVHTGLWNNNTVTLAVEAEISRGGQVCVY